VLQEGFSQVLKLMNEVVYCKLNIRNHSSPLIIKLNSIDANYKLYLSFFASFPSSLNSLMKFPQSKELLYKLKVPSKANTCFFAVSAKSVV